MIRESELDPTLVVCLRALEPYLDQLVVVGGWAPYLYCRMYEDELQREPLITRDFDNDAGNLVTRVNTLLRFGSRPGADAGSRPIARGRRRGLAVLYA